MFGKYLPPLLLAILALNVSGAERQSQLSTRRSLPSTYYVKDADLRELKLSPPPAVGSDVDKSDLTTLKDWHAKRTAGDCARANTEAIASYDAFFGAISPFPRPQPKEVAAFFDHVRDDTSHGVGIFKTRYARTRPFNRDSSLTVCIPKESSSSYPSGHSALARVFALVLSDLAPERRAEFLARADQIALDRVIGGVHHPSDIAAGKLLGDEIHAELVESPAFLADLERQRRRLKR